MQAILHSRQDSGSHSSKHTHYLKGILRCNRCSARLGYGHSKGSSGGRYTYFFCLGRHTGRTGCDLPYLDEQSVEKAVEQHWMTVTFTEDFINHVRAQVTKQLDEDGLNETLIADQEKRLKALERQKRKWLDAYAEGAISIANLKERQTDIGKQTANANKLIADAKTDHGLILGRLNQMLNMMSHAHTFYLSLSDQMRQAANAVTFETISINVLDNDEPNSSQYSHAASTPTGLIQAVLTIHQQDNDDGKPTYDHDDADRNGSRVSSSSSKKQHHNRNKKLRPSQR